MGRLRVQIEPDNRMVPVPQKSQRNVKDQQERPGRSCLQGAHGKCPNREEHQHDSHDAQPKILSALARCIAVRLPVRVEVHRHPRGQLIPVLPILDGADGQHQPHQPDHPRRWSGKISIHARLQSCKHSDNDRYLSPDISLHSRTYARPFSKRVTTTSVPLAMALPSSLRAPHTRLVPA